MESAEREGDRKKAVFVGGLRDQIKKKRERVMESRDEYHRDKDRVNQVVEKIILEEEE